MAFNSNLVNFLTVGNFATDSSYEMPLSQQLVTSSVYGLTFANAGAGSTYTLQTTGNMRALMTLQSSTSYGVVISVPQADGGLITRQLTGSSSVSITNGGGAAGNPTLSVTPSTTVQLINTSVSGSAIGSARSTLNFIPGANVGINAVDSGGRTNITISSTANAVVGSGPFVTFTANASLVGAQNIGLLTTGLVKNTVTAGSALLSTAVAGTDYLLPNAALAAFAALTPANGNLLYYTGGTWTALSAGAAGTVLTSVSTTALGWAAAPVELTATVTTTNATVTTLASIPLAFSKVTTVKVTISAASADYTNGCGGTIVYAARRGASGNVIELATALPIVLSTSTATFNGSVNTGTQSIIITVTGIAATTYNWSARYTVLTA